VAFNPVMRFSVHRVIQVFEPVQNGARKSSPALALKAASAVT
jgi:hypothetical protein